MSLFVVNDSIPINTGIMMPKIDSVARIMAAEDADAYFCPIFWKRIAIVVHIIAKYPTPKIPSLDKTVPELSSNTRVTMIDKIAAIVNCKMVIRIGSLPSDNFVTATMWAANKSPANKAKTSPNIASLPWAKTEPPFPPAMDTKYMPPMVMKAATILNLSGIFLITSQDKNGTITQYDADKKADLPGSVYPTPIV